MNLISNETIVRVTIEKEFDS